VEQDKISFPVGVPSLPEQKQLLSSLKAHCKHLNEKGKKPVSFRSHEEYMETVSGIVQSFKSYHAWLMDDVIIANIKLENGTFDWSDQKKLDELVRAMKGEFRDFMKLFVASQQFNIYGEKLLEIIMTKPKSDAIPAIKGHKTKKANLSVGDVSDSIVQIFESLPLKLGTSAPSPYIGEIPI